MKATAQMGGLTNIHDGVVHTEPCVAVMKLRAIDGDGETWDNWCIKHHHWLNGAPAKSIVDTLIPPERP